IPPMPGMSGLPRGQTVDPAATLSADQLQQLGNQPTSPDTQTLLHGLEPTRPGIVGLPGGQTFDATATPAVNQSQDIGNQPLLPPRTASLPQSGQATAANATGVPLLPPRAPTATAALASPAAPGPMGFCRYVNGGFTLNVQWPAGSACPSFWCQGW